MDKMSNHAEIRWAKVEPGPDVDGPLKRASIVIGFSKAGWGFGEFTIVQDAEGRVFVDAEHCGKEMVLEAFSKLLEGATFDHEYDSPQRHAFNTATGRRGCDCPECKRKEEQRGH
jgi:hypothetical protein